MQISKVSEVGGCGEGRAGAGGPHAEYQTASELFDLMTKNTHFDRPNEYTLSAQDLVLLYQNIDIGTRLMKDASQVTIKKPNQYVETIVYNDDHESGSDCSEIGAPNDMLDFMLNQERLDFLNDKSLENLLCPKFGGLEMHNSALSFDYNKSFLFQDPYIKHQLENLNLMGTSSTNGNLFSTSLIDYICCKRLEDNYNFYMDNIIRYVQHTIEQLKRISNGDYLTDRAKEKWMEVNSNTQPDDNTKVLATSTSIPLHVECKENGNVSWDDIVHSEVDVRSLSKILEKKIVVEIPKLICGSYRLYSKRCADNLVISCQREQQAFENEGQESRVDVVLQLQRSQTGQVMSNISSIMILKTTPALPDLRAKAIRPLPYKETTDENTLQNSEKDAKEPTITVIELIRDLEPVVTELEVKNTIADNILEEDNDDYQDSQNEDSYAGTTEYPFSDRIASYASIQYSSESSLAVKDTFSVDNVEEKTYNLISPDELHMTMRRLNMQNTVLNESGEDTMSQSTSKRRSPVRVRIKSPYENKSLLMEEKKRKRLLEIRDKREKKKIALSESCKISKHKYAKGAVLPQASSSVTKLSITNKSFYNSIYGHNSNTENKLKSRKPLKSTPEISLAIDETQEDFFESPMLSPHKNSEKYINRSYYLDDAETEMMHMQMKINEMNETEDIHNSYSASDSNVSNEFNASLEILQGLINTSDTNLDADSTFLAVSKLQTFPEASSNSIKSLMPIEDSNAQLSTTTQNITKKSSTSDECRQSIDKLYELINKFGKPNDSTDPKNLKVNLNDSNILQDNENPDVKHKDLRSSRKDSPGRNHTANSKQKTNKAQSAGLPKVTISSKLHSSKTETDKTKKERNRPALFSSPFKGPLPNNPLKAISQLLHEFDTVQKNRQKPSTETKSPKKVENVANDCKIYSRQGSSRRKSRIDQLAPDQEKKALPSNINPKDKRIKPLTPLELTRTQQKQFLAEDKNFDKIPPKKLTDIIDEAKEARGEAVRGPSKNYSRLDNLAQPKKSYVTAHHEEYQHKFGKNIRAQKLRKLASASTALIERHATSPTSPSNRNKLRKSGTESPIGTALAKQRAPSVPQLDQQKAAMCTRKRQPTSSSLESAARIFGLKHALTIEAPDRISCKMGAVESYVQNHFRGTSALREEPEAGLRSRVPLVPQDLASMTLAPPGPRPPPPGPPAAPLATLAECTECADSIACIDKPRSESDYCVNCLEDCHLATAVDTVYSESTTSHSHHLNSTAEMEQLETALCSHISGTFQKRLRIKNLTLTPKTSTQQVFLLQSGDVGSVLNSVSNLKLRKNSVENFNELKAMSVLSKSHLDWTFAQFPAEITTVGCAFPEFKPQHTGARSKLTEIPASVASKTTAQKFCQSDQYPRGSLRDTSSQVDVVRQFTAELVAVSLASAASSVFNTQDTTAQMLRIETGEVNTHVGGSVTVNNLGSSSESNTNKAVEETDSGVKEEGTVDVKNGSLPWPAPAPSPAPSAVPEDISYTTSLDMLVGLLTEIQKITCQNQVTCKRQNCTDIDIPNDTISVNNVENTGCDLISLSSLENLRKLESNPSIYSYYLSNNEGSVKSIEPVVELKRNSRFTENSVDIQPITSGCIVTEHVAVGMSKPALVDKEVSTFQCEGHVNMCTNVPSDVHCGLVHFGANMSSSALDAGEPLSYSSLSIDYHTPHVSATKNVLSKNTIESQIETKQRRALISRDKVDLNDKCFTILSIRNIEDVKKESLIARRELRYCVKNIDLDPMFKIKRDLLVSMYSILVLTVFAALSFPELLMFQS